MKRFVTILAAMLLALSMFAGPAVGEEHPPLERHGHMLVLGVQYEVEEGDLYAVGFRKCIDMPVVPLKAHHANVHTGQAGMALEGAGHAFVPSYNYPFVPWDNCEDFEEFLPLNLGPAE